MLHQGWYYFTYTSTANTNVPLQLLLVVKLFQTNTGHQFKLTAFSFRALGEQLAL